MSLYIQKYVQYRKRKNFFPESGRIADLIPIMVKHKAENYFVPQSSVHTDEIKNMLDEAGLQHDEAVMYYTVTNDFGPDLEATIPKIEVERVDKNINRIKTHVDEIYNA